MADVAVNPTASYTVAADVVGTVGYQRIKIDIGASGVTSGDVGATNPMPVSGTVSVSGAVQVSGAVSVSAMPAVSGTVTVNGSVAVVPGVSVVAQVSGTVTIAPTTLTVNTAAALPGSTTGASGVSGVVVWLGASQTVLISTQVSGTVTAIVTGAVSISAMPAVSISVSAVLGTIVTQLGTQMVSMAQTSVSVAAIPTILTIVTQLGTQIVSVVPGVSVSAVVSGTITNIPLYSTTATPAVDATGGVVWVANPGAAVATTVLTVQTILGTAVVSVVPGLSVAISTNLLTTAIPAAASTGVIVWNAGLNVTTALPAANASGQVVWNAGLLYTVGLPVQASTAQIVVVKPAPMQAIQIKVTGTAIAVSANKYLFTIWTGLTGAPAAAGTTSWAVPAGKVLRLNNLQIAVTSSAVLGGSVQAFVGVGATASMISASISTQLQLLKIQVFGAAALQSAAINDAGADVTAGESIAIFVAASTAAVMRDLLITGQLF